ncbi:hypothetical protein LOD99_7545 [Oopsacas minuta]|uniref:Alpha-endosulfine n=1 Tax=Oopsacas minuta TaxID=111878 RepID=A0AAV7JPN6_9METZ|nr:hypothetical protein LOD99_7545 [Oopsacas minuta]
MSVQGKFIQKPQLIGQGANGQAEAEFKSKYPNTLLSNKDLLRRKVSSQGGKQYFDSGDYVMKKKKIPGMHSQPPSLLDVGTEVATVDKIPVRKTSQKVPIPITSPKKSNLVSAPGLTVTTHSSEPHRDISPMATNPPANPLTRHHMPAHMQFQERAPHTVTMETPASPPAISTLVSSPPPEADTDDMV